MSFLEHWTLSDDDDNYDDDENIQFIFVKHSAQILQGETYDKSCLLVKNRALIGMILCDAMHCLPCVFLAAVVGLAL